MLQTLKDMFEQKVRMAESMWRLAYAGGTIAAHENRLLREMADLLHLPHGACVNVKMRAKAASCGA